MQGRGPDNQDALSVCLLYPQQREQYKHLEESNNNNMLVDVYGCEYLLRLIVKLPILMKKLTPIITTVLQHLDKLLAELILWMHKNSQSMFFVEITDRRLFIKIDTLVAGFGQGDFSRGK